MAVQRPRICVLGAGISGLSTAIQIQNSGLDAIVTIVADKVLSETTSSAAAGLLMPHLIMDTPEHLQRRWSEATFKRLEELYMGPECAQAGVSLVSGYVLFKDDGPQDPKLLDPFWKNIVKNFRVVGKEELKQFPGYTKGTFCSTLVSESLTYMEFLTNIFRGNGGRLLKRKIQNLEELSDDCDIIVNCSGALANSLVADKEVKAVRGQVVLVHAPWVKHFYIGKGYHVIPGNNGVTLGGVNQWGRWDTAVDSKDKADILKGTSELLPSLKGAKFIRDKVGLRPVRNSVRLERQDIFHGKKRVPVIHNYGHGGSGFTVHWGCSLDAAKLVVEAAREIIQSKL